ncbi:MAG: hypothetical protein AAF989_04175, partial [Planctomycetota bacterium]
AAGDLEEAEIRMQWAPVSRPEESDWVDYPWNAQDWPLRGGMGTSDRRQTFLRSAVVLSEAEQFGLVAAWMEPALETLPDAKIIRLIRVPSLLSSVTDDSAPPPYTARVLRSGFDGDPKSGGRARLVHVEEPRLVAIANGEPANGEPEAPRVSDESGDEP